ncbi:phage holin family protein [Nigerium massiliense]|uniref:phage holin family protein n=1 Tax=Nigerium massiliense TaxID=1522317 RepID=UPI00058F4AF4|nr:phage holin family protein [Nigerium massiliense]
MRLLLRLIATAIAVGIAAWLVPGITVTGPTATATALTLAGVALILGLVNALVKPLATVLSTCLIVATFGLFLFVLNALMLMLTSWIAGQLGIGFHVDGFWPALIGSVIISVVSWLVSGVFGVNRPDPQVRQY